MSEGLFYGVWFLNAALMVGLVTPLARGLAHRIGLVDRPGEQEYKWHARPTAYLGGMAILMVVVVVAFSGHTPAHQVIVILLGAAGCGLIGAIDDWKSLGAVAKILPCILGAVGLWLVDIRVGATDIVALDFLLTALWVAAITQSLNVIDNMDGVATGLAAIASLSFLVLALLNGETRVALLAAALAGACTGFLPYNYRGASVFLGDAGTLSIGFLLAALSLANDLPGSPPITRTVVPYLILGVPLFNTVLVSVSRLRGHRPIHVGGTDGTSHRLVSLGLNHAQAAVVFWMAGAMLGTAGVILSVLSALAALLTATVATGIGLSAIWYFEFVYKSPTETLAEPTKFRSEARHEVRQLAG